MNKIEELKNKTDLLLETQMIINTITKTLGESEVLNKRYEELNKKISSNIRLIKELEK